MFTGRFIIGRFFLPGLIIIFFSCAQNEDPRPLAEVNFVTNIDNQPVFSWKRNQMPEGHTESAAQIILSDNLQDINKGTGNIWDSGKQRGLNSLQTVYQATHLEPGARYYFRVKTWDQNDRESEWSETVDFFTPLNYPEDWEAEWISFAYHPDSALPVFKTAIVLDESREIDFARFYISAPGFYEAYLDGRKIGENVLDPGQTNYEDYAFYTAYTIDKQDLKKNSSLAVMAGNGWYNQNDVWLHPSGEAMMVYGQPVFVAQLVVHYQDGSRDVTSTGPSWKWTYGPISYSNIYGGEYYDANREVNLTLEDDMDNWMPALPAEVHPTELIEQYASPIKKMGEIKVKKILDTGDGKYILDMGENFSGWLKIKGTMEKGRQIVIRFAEELDREGRLDPATTGVRATGVVQTSAYTFKGEGEEIWEPRFTYHGFRYAEVSGLSSKPGMDMFTGIRVYSSVETVGFFASSEPNLNKLHELATRTITSNIHSIPTDCPHRERCGWTGDAHALVSSLFSNYDARSFMTKYVFDMRSSGREEKEELYFAETFHHRSIRIKPAGITTMIVPGKRTSGMATADWGTAMVQVPWNLYLYYGDFRILEEYYEDMKVWVDYIHQKNVNGIIPHGLGDWCPPYSWEDRCPVPLSSSAFHLLDVEIMKNVAKILGKEEDAQSYEEMYDFLKGSFNEVFLDREKMTYGTQTANAMALELGLAPEDVRKGIAAALVEESYNRHKGFINTGIFGIGRIFPALCENGFEEEAYRLLTKTGEHSFAHMWDKWDATTLWETLPVFNPDSGRIKNAYYKSSHSHPMQAGFDAWFFNGIAGINPVMEAPGFRKIVFKPYLTSFIDKLDCSYESGFGLVISSWKHEGEKLVWTVGIPAGAEGEIWVPFRKGKQIRLNGKKAGPQGTEKNFVSLGVLSSGEYKIEVL